MRAYLLLLGLAGCQLAFPNDDVEPPPVDGAPDTPGCAGNGHDEDSDLVADDCDNCPTIGNASQANMAEVDAMASADALGDACDPNPTLPGDSILHYDAMLTTTGFVITAGTLVMGSPGTVRLGSNSRVELLTPIANATNVQLRARVDGNAGDATAFVRIENGTSFCQARSASCDPAMDVARSCVIGSSGGTPTGMTVPEPLAALQLLEQRQTDCLAVTDNAQQSTPPTAIASPATFAVSSGSLGVAIDSLIIYGQRD